MSAQISWLGARHSSGAHLLCHDEEDCGPPARGMTLSATGVTRSQQGEIFTPSPHPEERRAAARLEGWATRVVYVRLFAKD